MEIDNTFLYRFYPTYESMGFGRLGKSGSGNENLFIDVFLAKISQRNFQKAKPNVRYPCSGLIKLLGLPHMVDFTQHGDVN